MRASVTKPLLRSTSALLPLLAFLTGASLTSDPALAADDGLQATFSFPMETVRKAAVDALTVIGCDIKKSESGYVEGYRSHKIGAFVGSGGETVTVRLTSSGEGQTSAEVRTKKSLLGIAGQKNWDKPVLDEMEKTLPAAASTPAATADHNPAQ